MSNFPSPSPVIPKKRLTFKRFRALVSHRFSLMEGKCTDQEAERRIREGVDLYGATPWILMFAIVIASIGLNVNSTAVIIGAMLISPLMGPIMGAGLGVAVYDFALLKRALVNLAIATLISWAVSTLYFLISPLQQAQSELLARTTPTLWDVLIACFGGLAGTVGITRQEKSNVVPGVAIATALMPPICTAGYGLATGQWAFMGGALYLYTINCVFIALSTILGIRLLRLKPHRFADAATEKRVKLSLWLLALGTALPSAYLATTLVKDEVFNVRARHFIQQEFSLSKTHVAEVKISPKARQIEVALIGAPLSDQELAAIKARLSLAQLPQTQLTIHQASGGHVDVMALKSSMLSDLYLDAQAISQKKDEEIRQLRDELALRTAIQNQANEIARELRAQYPQLSEVLIGEGVMFNASQLTVKMLHVRLQARTRLSTDDLARIRRWLRVRTEHRQISLSVDYKK